MKVQNRLSITNTIVFSLIFTLMMCSVVFVFYQSSKRSIYHSLKKTSYITALFHLEEDELSEMEFDKVREQFDYEAFNQIYQFYNEHDSIEFGESSGQIPNKLLQEVRVKDSLSFESDDFLCYGIYYKDNQGDYVVVAKEKKEVLDAQIRTLIVSMFIIWLLGVGITLFVNMAVARHAYKPFVRVINEVKALDIDGDNLQINNLSSKDELALLVDTFNVLLSRISETLESQRNFVRYVSHEFKTPLAVMMGNVDVLLLKQRSEKEYHDFVENLVREIQYLEETLNTLILLTNSKVQQHKKKTATNIDELVWISVDKLKKKYEKLKVSIHLPEVDSSFFVVMVNANEVLVGITNILDNAVKYSENEIVEVNFLIVKGQLILKIQDFGVGIESHELENVFKPFYRSSEVKNVPGSGLGLTLVSQLFERNNVEVSVESVKGVGTTFTLIFKAISSV